MKSFLIRFFLGYHFDYEENFFGLLKQFRHLSLFSICLHFLRCVRSCEHVWGTAPYCRLCSRVCNTEFKSRNIFQDIIFSKDKAVLGLTSNYRINLDVFYRINVDVSNADDYSKYFFEKNEKCCYFKASIIQKTYLQLSHQFCSEFICICASSFFSYIDLNICDNRRIRNLILNHGCYLFSKFWHETNIDFFYEFFDILEKYKLSFCFKNSVKKLQFGPYYSHAFDKTLTTINL